ncbi:12636_t:CDS:2, partial [Funneliformis caledonium]
LSSNGTKWCLVPDVCWKCQLVSRLTSSAENHTSWLDHHENYYICVGELL